MSGWILTDKQTPPIGSRVLVTVTPRMSGLQTVIICRYVDVGAATGAVWLSEDGWPVRRPLAWMELPEPYRGGGRSP